MSSDDDTPSLEKDAGKKEKKNKNPSGLRRRFKLFKHKSTPKEGLITADGLYNICSISSGIVRPLPSDTAEDIESGVDVLEDGNLQNSQTIHGIEDEKEILSEISEQIENIEVDTEQVLNVRELNGIETREAFSTQDRSVTVFAPVGFVDMRNYVERTTLDYRWVE